MENKQLKENKQLIEELENAFGDGFSFNLDEINPDEYASNSFSKESDDGVCSTAHPSLMSILEKKVRTAEVTNDAFNEILDEASILEKKVRTAEELELLKTESCFVNIIYNDGSVLVLHTTLNPKVLAKQFTYQKENALFDLDRYRYFRIDDDDDCTQIKITKENIYENNELISFINSVL